MKLLKLSTLSSLALAASLSFGVAKPAEANVFGLLFQKKHHAHQQHHQPRHHGHNVHHGKRRVHYYRGRNRHRANHHTRHHFPRRRVFNHPRRHGNWHY